MLAQLVDRRTMIQDLARYYGVDEHLFRVMDQPVVERAYLYAIYRWS